MSREVNTAKLNYFMKVELQAVNGVFCAEFEYPMNGKKHVITWGECK